MNEKSKYTKNSLRFPNMFLSAEHLTIGYLLRRNIMAYKAPPNNEGYDLICINPDPKTKSKIVKVQVKSRYQTDSNREFNIKKKSLEAFDFMIAVFLNIGYFYRKKPTETGLKEPEIYTLPAKLVNELHVDIGGWEKIKTKNINLDKYKNEKGFELIAKKLNIKYPSRENYANKK